MLGSYISQIVAFISAHTQWIGFAVFTATALESIAIIGSIFPGMSVVIALSGIAASLGANIWGLVVWCVAGAVLGDGVSFWLGLRFGTRLKRTWPLSKTPELLDKSVVFFQRHGAKSIVLGRFIPVTRAVIPVAAGMLGMSPMRFYTANILSAIGWGLISVLPAAGLGMAFTFINAASSRVAFLFVIMLTIVFVAWILANVTTRLVLPWFETLFARLYDCHEEKANSWTHLFVRVFGAQRRPAVASVAWLAVTIVLAAAFVGILEDIVSGDPLVRADVAINHFVLAFRTSLGDEIMVAITAMGDFSVVAWTSAVLLAGLLIMRAWRTFGLAVSALAGTALFVSLLKWLLHKPRPIELYSGMDAFSFPSGHAAFAGVLWGIVAVLITRGLSRGAQAFIWSIAFSVSILIGLSRIYLSAHWPSDVMGGLLFGWAMAGVFALFEERIGDKAVRPVLLGGVTALCLVVVWSFHSFATFDESMARYTPRQTVVDTTNHDWLEGGWASFARARVDLGGEYEEPLSLQFGVPLKRIETTLQSAGWRRAPPWGWRELILFVGTHAFLAQWAPLPLLHNGKAPVLTMIAPDATQKRRVVLRLWRTATRIVDVPGKPFVVLSSLRQERLEHPLTWINVLREKPVRAQTKATLVSVLRATASLRVRAPSSDSAVGLVSFNFGP